MSLLVSLFKLSDPSASFIYVHSIPDTCLYCFCLAPAETTTIFCDGVHLVHLTSGLIVFLATVCFRRAALVYRTKGTYLHSKLGLFILLLFGIIG